MENGQHSNQHPATNGQGGQQALDNTEGGKKSKKQAKKKRAKLRKKQEENESRGAQNESSQSVRAAAHEEIHYTSESEEESESENSLDKKRTFALQLLRPLCVALMQNRTPENVDAIAKALPLVDSDILKEIQIYITFPIHSSLNYKHMTEPLLISLCNALQKIFQRTEIQCVQIFFNVFNPLLFFLAPPNKTDYQIKSEEAKLAVLKTLQSLWHRPRQVQKHLYKLQYMPAYGQLISSLLSIAEFEKSRELQVEALITMRYVLMEKGVKSWAEAQQMSDLFAFIVPGVTVSLTRILTGDEKQGHKVFGHSMYILVLIIGSAVGDMVLEKTDTEYHLPSDMDAERRRQLLSLVVKRDAEWVKNTAAKFKIVLERVCKVLLKHDHVETRYSLLNGITLLITTCSKSLEDLLPLFLETLISLMQDPEPRVSQYAQSYLRNKCFGLHKLKEISVLTEMLQENLYQLTTALPRHIRVADEEDKLRTIRLLNGYISILGSNINCVLLSSTHLHRLCLALVQSLELDASEIKIVEERGSLVHQDKDLMENTDKANLWRPRKYFKHFRNNEVWLEFAKVCRQLGRFGNLFVLVDHLMELYHESALYKLAAALVINEVIYGANDNTSIDSCLGEVPSEVKNTKELQDVISMVLEEYVKDGNLQLPDIYDDSKNVSTQESSAPSSLGSSFVFVKNAASLGEKKSLANRNRAVLLVCLFMEGIAKFTTVLGWDFEVHFIKALYPVVENLGHENIYISHTAYYALAQICDAWVYKSLDDLLQKNADYLMNSVTLRLRHFSHHRRCPQTISVMLRYCSKELLPLIKHNIAQLMDTLDDRYTEDLVLFLPVLLELASAIGRWFPSEALTPSTKVPSENATKPVQQMDPQSIVSFVKEYTKQKMLSETFEDTEENGGSNKEDRTLSDIKDDIDHLLEEKKKEDERKEKEEEEMEEEDEDGGEVRKKDNCPLHIQMVKDIVQRVKHFLSSHDGRLRVQAVDILCQCCVDLHDSENELLPALHQTWPGFHPLFRSEDKYIVIKAIKALVSISALSKDFLQQRVLKDVVPGLLSCLDTQGKISSGSRPAYLHTVNFKLQLCILSNIGPIVRNLQIAGFQLDKIAKTCLPYLCSSQPQLLQKACTDAFSSFIAINSDAIWLMLIQSYCPFELTPPGPEFVPVKIPPSARSANSLSANITELMTLYFS